MFDEESYGIIPLRKKAMQWQVFLVQLKSGSHWGFPKGHLENDESPQKAAQRELFEETSLKIDHFLCDTPLIEKYTCRKNNKEISKQVTYFIAVVSGDVFIQAGEVIDGRWVDLKKAKEVLTYAESKKVLEKLQVIIENLS